MAIRFLSCGDAALSVQFGESIDKEVSAQVLRLDAAVRRAAVRGVVATVPTYRSLLVHYDPLEISAARATERLEALIAEESDMPAPGRRWSLPACYAPDLAPDLETVATRVGLTPDDVVALHSATTYHVYMIGFLPGYPYMGDLPEQLVLPRREDPRLRVPPGAVAIATTMTAVYPVESPGGWHLIGSTPVRLFDAAAERPALLAPGDQVRFAPVDEAEYREIAAACDAGAFDVPSEAVEA